MLIGMDSVKIRRRKIKGSPFKRTYGRKKMNGTKRFSRLATSKKPFFAWR